jgi:hypothetical protein
MKNIFAPLLCAFLISTVAGCDAAGRVDVLVVGGSASGISAGVSAARSGARTLIVEPGPWLGGMLTSAGVSCVDGNNKMRAGLFGEFIAALETHYGGPEAIRTGWVSYAHFEPSVGNEIFNRMAAAESNLEVWHGFEFADARRTGGVWKVRFTGADGETRTVKAKVMIDATELGDVAKTCGVGYDLGMESAADTGEEIAPQQANHIIQDLTWAATLKDYGRDVTIPRPEGYDPAEFACSCINERCVTPTEPGRMWPPDKMITYGKMPGGKFMINWPVEGNDYYVDVVEMTPAERAEALEPAKARTMRFLYFIQHELGMNTLGLADDEFPTEDGLPLIPYHRESRRIHGLVRFTLQHISEPFSQPHKLYRTSIAVGDYPVDHHHARYDGTEELPDLHFHPVPSFGLPLGALLPQGVEGLIVAEKSISVSNIVNGTTRLQPVVMQIGQAAGALAALAVKRGVEPSQVAVRDVQRAVLAGGGYLMPYIDVKPADPRFGALQRVGSTGIMKGVGKNVGWSNETWFRADEPLTADDLAGLTEFYPVALAAGDTPVTVAGAITVIGRAKGSATVELADEIGKILSELGGESADSDRPILRGEMAVLIDRLLDPFNARDVDITGNFIE